MTSSHSAARQPADEPRDTGGDPVEEYDEVSAVKGQLLVFARELNRVFHAERSRREELEAALDELADAYLSMVKTLAYVVETKDTYTRQHLERTYHYAVRLAREVEPAIADDRVLGYGFLLHDVGKVGVPEAILTKPGPLDPDEWEVMRRHPVIGEEIVAPIAYLAPAVQVIRHHHERWDGRGYPDGLAGEDIPTAARIFTVVDCFDAMTSDRPYRKALDLDAATEEIERHAGAQFDPEIVRAFLRVRDTLWGDPHEGDAAEAARRSGS